LKNRIVQNKKQTAKPNTFHQKIEQTLKELAPFLIKKDTAYGDATRKIIRCLEELYPNGIPVEAIGNVYYMIQILNKFSRIATDNDPFGESPWLDSIGYSTLAHSKHELRREANDKQTACTKRRK